MDDKQFNEWLKKPYTGGVPRVLISSVDYSGVVSPIDGTVLDSKPAYEEYKKRHDLITHGE